MLKIENLEKTYANGRGIHNISFSLKAGEIMGIIGENGSGKTTLFKILLSLKKADKGNITYNKARLDEIPLGKFGYLPEERAIYKDITVNQQIEHVSRLKRMDSETTEDRRKYWLEKMWLIDYQNSRINELSKGNQQKVQFICSLMHDPEIIILDEPLTGLDVISASQIKEVISELAKQKKTILLSSHQFDHVEGFFSKVLILKNGENMYCGDVMKLKKSTEKRYIRIMTDKAKDYYLEDGVVYQEVNGKEVSLLLENEEKARLLFEKLLNDEPLNSITLQLPTLKDIIRERNML